MQRLHGHKKAVNGVAFSPDGAMLASAASDGVCVWDLATGKPRWRADVDYADQPAFSPDGRWLAAVGLEFGFWEATTGRPGPAIEVERGEPLSCAFSPDGKLFVVGTDDDEDAPYIYRWSTRTWKRKGFTWHTVPFQCCAFRPDGKILATAGKSRILLCNSATGAQLTAVESATRHDSLALAWSTDGKLLLHAAGRTVSVRYGRALKEVVKAGRPYSTLDRRALTEIAVIEQPKRYFLDVAMHPGGRFIATASKDGIIQFWDMAAWTELQTFAWDIGGLRCVTFAADGLRAACGGDKGKIIVWDVD
jgi:WD40 repeat protein